MDPIIGDPQRSHTWALTTEISCSEIAATHERMLELVEEVMRGVPILSPTEVEGTTIYVDATETPLSTALDKTRSGFECDRFSLEDSAGFSFRDIREYLHSKERDEKTALLRGIKLDGPSKLHTGEEYRYVSPETPDLYGYRGGSDGTPVSSPLFIRVLTDQSNVYLDHKPAFIVSLTSYSTVWFEDTLRGGINRERLDACLQRLIDRLDPDHVRFDSALYREYVPERHSHFEELFIGRSDT